MKAILEEHRMAFVFLMLSSDYHDQEIKKFSYHTRSQNGRCQGIVEGKWNER